MNLTWPVAVALLSLGCVPDAYRGGGTVYRDNPTPTGRPPAAQALLASAAIHLSCPDKQLASREMGHLDRNPYATLFIVEGCGKRATYFQACHFERPASHDATTTSGQPQQQFGPLGGSEPSEPAWEPHAEYICDYLLLARTEIQ
jgi:hypothetical protein